MCRRVLVSGQAIRGCGGLTFKGGLLFLTGTVQLKSNLVLVVEASNHLTWSMPHMLYGLNSLPGYPSQSLDHGWGVKYIGMVFLTPLAS